jgi:hypothetical protein
MTTFSPRDWWNPSHWSEHDRRRRRPEDRNREVFLRWLTALAFSLCFSTLAPAHLFAVAFASLLFLAGLASLGIASLQRHDPLATHLTAWDEAAWSFALSFGLQAWLGL